MAKIQNVTTAQLSLLRETYAGNQDVLKSLDVIESDIKKALTTACPCCKQTGTDGNGNACEMCDGNGRSNDQYQIKFTRIKTKL